MSSEEAAFPWRELAKESINIIHHSDSVKSRRAQLGICFIAQRHHLGRGR